MKKTSLFLTLLISCNAMAHNIQSWKEYTIPYSYILSLDIHKHKKCSPTKSIIKAIQEKNPGVDLNKLKIGDNIILPVCNNIDTLYQATNIEESSKNYPDIVGWEETTVKSGYNLSSDLHFNKECSKIWTKQIYEFKNKNPQVKNPNILYPKDKILVQKCGSIPQQLVEEANKLDSVDKISKIVESYMANNYLAKDGWQVEFYAGISSFTSVAQGIGVGIRGNLMENTGVDFRTYSFASNALILAEIEFKSENFRLQRNFSLGIGEQFISDKKSDEGGIAWWSYGYVYRPTSHNLFEINLGTNFSTRIAPNIEVQGLKRMKGDFWIGWFGEVRSLNSFSPLNKNNPLYISGLKMSF